MEKSAKDSLDIDHLGPTLSKKSILAKTTKSSAEFAPQIQSKNAKGSGIVFGEKFLMQVSNEY
jgi:hypothetical protein